jgi:hypothetical protein
VWNKILPNPVKKSTGVHSKNAFLEGAKVKSDTVEQMQSCLDKLGIPLTVVWVPGRTATKHGSIDLSSKTLLIFDETEKEAWLTFEHELYEYKFREVTAAYRTLINSLIESVEKIVYERKETFLEFIPKFRKIIKKENNSSFSG